MSSPFASSVKGIQTLVNSKVQSFDAPRQAKTYARSLFPALEWLPRYNWTWFFGDLIAGLTVGSLVIPQALSYAKLAGVPVQYGLYTSFVGLLVYFLFSTSKDVTIGPTAVLSILIGQLMQTYNTNGLKLDPVEFVTSLALIAGLIQLAIGLFRMGVVVDLISVPIVVGFTTGAALQIIFGQLSGLFGIPNINTNDPPYLVLYNTLRNLNQTNIDVAFGLSSVALLVAFRIFTKLATDRGHKWAIWVGFAANAITLVIFTLISFLVYRTTKKIPIKIVGSVPTGLTYIKTPSLSNLSSLITPAVSIVLVGIIEQIAMVKAFGRVNGYLADANQEIVSLGLVNVIGPFFGAFAATGSLSRSSIKSRSGVKTPLSGVFAAVLVLASIYFLTPAFFWIPSSTLSAIISVSLTDLISRPSVIKRLWDIELLDFISFQVAFWLTIFVSIEVAICSAVGFSVLVLLYRIARPRLSVLVRLEKGGWASYDSIARQQESGIASEKDLPLPSIEMTPYPGIVVFRIEEALTYPNATHLNSTIRDWIQRYTLYGGTSNPADLLWNQSPSPSTSNALISDAFGSDRPKSLSPLLSIVFDLSAVNRIDATGVQTLLDIKKDAEAHAGHSVPFYFAHVNSQIQAVFKHSNDWAGEGGQTIPFPHNSTNHDDISPSPSPETQSAPDVEKQSDAEAETTSPAISKFIFYSIDDAVDAASQPYHFGSRSYATII